MDADWSVSATTQTSKDRAWNQLGTSGSGNHFAEFGILTVSDDSSTPAAARPDAEDSFALAPGQYLALLSHSGSCIGTSDTFAQSYK